MKNILVLFLFTFIFLTTRANTVFADTGDHAGRINQRIAASRGASLTGQSSYTAVSRSHSSYTPSSDEDSNIVISNKTERYSFEEGGKDHPVVIHQEDKTLYYCSELKTAIPWAEMYDGQSSIDGVKIYINGSRDKTIQAKDENYSSGDIFFSDQRVYYFSLPFIKKGTSDEVDMEKTVILDPRYFTSVYFTEEQGRPAKDRGARHP